MTTAAEPKEAPRPDLRTIEGRTRAAPVAAPAQGAPKPAPVAKPAPAPGPMSKLALAKKERVITPCTFVIYGPEGVGKTTLACSAPDVILFDIEDGSTELETVRYPFRPEAGDRKHVPLTYQQVLDAIEDLTVTDHGFRTLAIDSLDRLESLLWTYLLERDSQVSAKNKTGEKLNSIEDYGYSKGYEIAVEEWRALCAKLDRLRYRRGMEIVMVGHAIVKTFKNPEGEDYDRWHLRINQKAAGFMKEWAKVTGFLTIETDVKKLSKFGRAKGISTGMRTLRFTRSAAIDAKTRLALPSEVLVDIADPWAPLAKALEEAGRVDPKQLKAQIEQEFERIGDPERAKRARGAIEEAVKHNDAGKLHRFLGELQKVPSKEEEEVSS